MNDEREVTFTDEERHFVRIALNAKIEQYEELPSTPKSNSMKRQSTRSAASAIPKYKPAALKHGSIFFKVSSEV